MLQCEYFGVKGGKRTFAARWTKGGSADKAAVRTERAECHFRRFATAATST